MVRNKGYLILTWSSRFQVQLWSHEWLKLQNAHIVTMWIYNNQEEPKTHPQEEPWEEINRIWYKSDKTITGKRKKINVPVVESSG